MIDHLRAFSKKIIWLKPVFFLATGAACIVFGYVVIFEQENDKDIFIIPSIVGALWSLVCSLLLLVFPYVPTKPDKQLDFFKRFKVLCVRAGYHLASLVFVLMSISVVVLTFKLLNVWYADF